MLEPEGRELLFDLLRPPDGWELGHAMGTSFTLDLNALMLAPLAFATFGWALDEEGKPDVMAMLEALRRNADRTTLFCQSGMTSLSGEYQRLLVYLEKCVVPVQAPTSGGIFHPKVWLLQFIREGEDPTYRLLCLSRNLTFDTSWDTVVVLDGRRRWKSQPSAPLAEFIRGLMELGGSRLTSQRREAHSAIAGDVAHVKFDHPPGYEDLRLHAMGFRGPAWPFPAGADRALVVSPFLGVEALGRLGASGEGNVLVSRPESLDGVGASAVEGFDRIHVLTTDVDDDTLVSGAGSGSDGRPSQDGLKGLHAKIYAFEEGDRLRLFTGSPNAGLGAFGGNVEFLVELHARTSEVSISGFLEGSKEVPAFGDLLDEYEPPEQAVEDEPKDKLASVLEGVQQALGALPFVAQATPVEGREEEFRLELTSDKPPELPEEVTEVHCWRISAGRGHLVTPRIDRQGVKAEFGDVSYDGLTSFFMFEVQGELEGQRDAVTFVVNAELRGAPEDRTDTVIARMLKDRDDLIRYLLFLLADSDEAMFALMEQMAINQSGGRMERGATGGVALMETLLRALVHNPQRISHVGRTLESLGKTGRLEEIAPEGLMELWEALQPVHSELVGEGAAE